MSDDSLDGTDWDVVICGTGLHESILALSLASHQLRILHLDRHRHYGSSEASFDLAEVDLWAREHDSRESKDAVSSHVRADPIESLRPRDYCVSLVPQIVLCQSDLISTVVRLKMNHNFDFLAVGSWWAYCPSARSLVKVPGSREDVFADRKLDMSAKRGIVKFFRFLQTYADAGPDGHDDLDSLSLPQLLTDRFKIPDHLHPLFLALVMSHSHPDQIPAKLALSRASKYLQSLPMYGVGFAGLVFKWGGLHEMIQASCRSCAVGGGVYALNQSIESVASAPPTTSSCPQDLPARYHIKLTDGSTVSTRFLAGFSGDEPLESLPNHLSAQVKSFPPGPALSHAVFILDTPLTHLFPPVHPEAPVPVGSVVYVAANSIQSPISSTESIPPVYLFICTSESGQCAKRQTIVYASMFHQSATHDEATLTHVVKTVLLDTVQSHDTTTKDDAKTPVDTTEIPTDSASTSPSILWQMFHVRTSGNTDHSTIPTECPNAGFLPFPHVNCSDAVFDDHILTTVKSAWSAITTELAAKQADQPVEFLQPAN